MLKTRGSLLAVAALALGMALSPAEASTEPLAPQMEPRLVLAVKSVEYVQNGVPILSREQVERVVERVNAVYAQCGLELKLEAYASVDPLKLGLQLGAESPDQMDAIRAHFDDGKYLVLIHTGAWSHDRMGPANAWTAMPGAVPSGAVLESLVAGSGNVTAHELGHALGLGHLSSDTDLMNPVIYSRSTRITADQCREMRITALTARAGALRPEPPIAFRPKLD